MMAFVALEVGFFIAAVAYSSFNLVPNGECGLILAIFVGLTFSVLLMCASAYYLYTTSKGSPDKSIHRQG